jgi:hypothetical protein
MIGSHSDKNETLFTEHFTQSECDTYGGMGVTVDLDGWGMRPLVQRDFTNTTNYQRYRACVRMMNRYGWDEARGALLKRIGRKREEGMRKTIDWYLYDRSDDTFIKDIDAMYRSKLEPKSALMPVSKMYDPGPQLLLKYGGKPSHPMSTKAFKVWGIAFRGDDRGPTMIYQQGFLPKTWPQNPWAQQMHFDFTNTLLDPTKYPDQVFWAMASQDIAQETAICVTRNVAGAVAFPGAHQEEGSYVGARHIYIYAVHIDWGFDTELQQMHSQQMAFAPGEKAVQSIPGFNVLGHALCSRTNWRSQFTLNYSIVRLPNGKFWSKNPYIDLSDAERLYLESVFSGGGSAATYRENGDHWVDHAAVSTKEADEEAAA